VVTVAYGHRWRRHFGRDQLQLAIDLLKKEPSSRQAVIVTWDPGQDGLSLTKKKNVPCPYTFTLNIIGGRLHLHNIVRSNDFILGAPADIAGFALLQCMISQELGVKPGIYSHSISNAHIYDNHFDGAKEIMKRKNNHKKITLDLPPKAFRNAEKTDRKLADKLVEIITKQYNPMEAISGLTISL
jgi:thymidylate synthase